MAVVKPEMKTYIWLQTADGSIQQIEEEVNPVTLSSILDYCRFHQVRGRSNKERKAFYDKLMRLDTEKLRELKSAAKSLQLEHLNDLTSETLARIIKGKSPEEIRDIFGIPDDLTEEDKLEPLKNVTGDPSIRRFNKLRAKKRKELKEREEKKIIEAKEDPTDDHPVDVLVSYINSGEKERKGGKTKKKNRKKNKPKKASNIDIEHQKEENGLSHSLESRMPGCSSEFQDHMSPSSIEHKSDDGDVDDELAREKELSFPKQEENDLSRSLESGMPGSSSEFQDHMSPSSIEHKFDDGDIDDEETDRLVEDFARNINLDWEERKREMLSSSQERKFPSLSLSGYGSTQKFKGKCFSQWLAFVAYKSTGGTLLQDNRTELILSFLYFR
ncbi:hypothetical protein RND81_05G089500 [Saponaria officinalis]|uniref:SKP1 component dimerisation domain-containing protein n=1 Tax=Saponaria officinalis TaxID=3572 RepID=A0AAW1KV39_SAPOF